MSVEVLRLAGEAGARGELASAVELYRAALKSSELSVDDRVRGLASLASVLRRSGEWRDAERAASAALELSDDASDPSLQALAKLELGTVMVLAFEAEAELEESDPLSIAMGHLDDAAKLFESLDRIDFYACLLAIARALSLCGEDARGIFARITSDLVAPKWDAASRASAATAQRVNYLRGRAFLELGAAELDAVQARELLEAARQLLSAAATPDLGELSRRIDELVAECSD